MSIDVSETTSRDPPPAPPAPPAPPPPLPPQLDCQASVRHARATLPSAAPPAPPAPAVPSAPSPAVPAAACPAPPPPAPPLPAAPPPPPSPMAPAGPPAAPPARPSAPSPDTSIVPWSVTGPKTNQRTGSPTAPRKTDVGIESAEDARTIPLTGSGVVPPLLMESRGSTPRRPRNIPSGVVTSTKTSRMSIGGGTPTPMFGATSRTLMTSPHCERVHCWATTSRGPDGSSGAMVALERSVLPSTVTMVTKRG